MILDYIKKELDRYDIEIPSNPYFARKMRDVYELVDCYMASKYREENVDALGVPNPFYNIVSFPVEVSSKMLDFDTKDINIIAQDGNYDLAWLFQKDLHFWLKDNLFSYDLNEYSYFLPKDGHLVVKKAKGKIQKVPIKNLRFRPDSYLKISQIPMVELHFYTEDEFEYERKKNGWNKGDITGGSAPLGVDIPDGKHIVYEAWFPKGFLDEKDNYFIVTASGDVLASLDMPKSPYKGLPWDKIEGRTTGRGQVEKLFDEQIYLNRIANYKAEGLHWSSKHLFQTRDTTINSNLLFDNENGDVLRVNAPLEPVAMEERNLSFYGYEESHWEQNSTKRTFSTEPVAGGGTKTGVPYRSSLLSAQMSGTYYKQKRDNLGEFIKEILYDWVLPEFASQTNKGHTILMKNLLDNSENSEKFFRMMINQRMNGLRSREFLTPEQAKIRRAINAEIIKKGKLEIPRGVYNDFKYKIDVNITGDEIDTGKIQMYDTIITALLQNPTALQDKRVVKLINEKLNSLGISPLDIGLEGEEQGLNEVVAQRGGSVASPSMQMPTPNNMQTSTVI